MEITLTTRQAEVLSKLRAQKQILRDEFQKLTNQEQDTLGIILDARGVIVNPNSTIRIDGTKMIIEGAIDVGGIKEAEFEEVQDTDPNEQRE